MTTRRRPRWPLLLSLVVLSCTEMAPPPQRSASVDNGRAALVVTQQTKLLPFSEIKYDSFGRTVSLSGDGQTSFIGAPTSTEDGLTQAGSVYVFTSTGPQKLLAGNEQSYASFGRTISLSADGQTAIIGAETEDNYPASSDGAAYVLARIGDSWTPQAHFLCESFYGLDYFGNAVALSADGQTAIVGAINMLAEENHRFGAAYIFVRTASGWNQQAKLLAEDRQDKDGFGSSVSLSADGSTALIGAYSTSDGKTDHNGSAYVFTRTGTAWSQQQKLLAEDKSDDDRLGNAVALSADGQTALVSASKKSEAGLYASGAAYVFVRVGTAWIQHHKLISSGPSSSGSFGASVSLSAKGDIALVGASQESEEGLLANGAAYVFTRHDAAWNQKAKLLASDKDSFALFGISVSLSADGLTALVGSFPQSKEGTWVKGAAYQFTLARAALGGPCLDGTDCTSGFCADGVCCATACDAGPCDACSVAAGALLDGTCDLLTGPLCDDANACTTSDTCQDGLCQGGAPVPCTPDECQQGSTCDPDTGACLFASQPDGTPCTSGLCLNGSCHDPAGTGGASGQGGTSGEAGQGDAKGGLSRSSGYSGESGEAGVPEAGGAAGSSGISGHGGAVVLQTLNSMPELAGGGCGYHPHSRASSPGTWTLAALTLTLGARRRKGVPLRRT